MFRFLETLERLAASVAMAEGGLFDEAVDMQRGQRPIRFVRDTPKKQLQRPRPRMHV